MNTPAPPVSLWCQKNSLHLKGRQASLLWWACNQGPRPWRQVFLHLHSATPAPSLELPGPLAKTLPLPLAPGTVTSLPTAFTVTRSGRYALEVRLTAVLDDGARLHWASQQELMFDINLPTRKGQTRIRVEGAGLVQNISQAQGDVDIRLTGPGVIKFSDTQPPAPGPGSRLEVAIPSLPPQEELLPVPLVQLQPPGLYPLDFTQLIQGQSWQRLDIHYADAYGRPASQCRVGDALRLRIRTYQSGHLLLIYRGASGNCYLQYPNRWAGQPGPLEPGHYDFPGPALMDMNRPQGWQEIRLQDPGDEQLLAVLAPGPAPLPIWDPGDAASPYQHTPGAIAQALQHLLAQYPGQIALGLASIRIV